MFKSTRNELLRDTNIELYTENQELKREVNYLQEELDNANEILASIEETVYKRLHPKIAEKIHKKIFN